jgi:NTP pyrophosphatase (non-canonical NTP hydrolase)
VDKGTMKINEIAEKNYQWVEQMGWHNKTVLEALALVASEVGEAINECRQEQPSADFAEELADIILRVLDIAHWQAIDIEKVIKAKMEKNRLQGNRGRLK